MLRIVSRAKRSLQAKYGARFFRRWCENGYGLNKQQKMSGVDFNTLRTGITMEQVLNQLGFEAVSRSGDQLRGPCPVDGSSSPDSRTFSVNLSSGRYFCHKCQSQGNQLELWAAVQNLTIYDAAIDLCRAVGREVPWIAKW